MIIIGYLVRGLFEQIPFYASDPLYAFSQQISDVPPDFSVDRLRHSRSHRHLDGPARRGRNARRA